ncbi:MAG TPA: ABC transporter ATP-binding protein [Arachnia sp.]|nr:ABC transporter ATP-binding protein [Arachnia sp.]HMT85963.1 ABC transporter ATP-binding protein [Arachnia sp.]
MSVLAELRGASVAYQRGGKSFVALTDASLAIEPGERIGIVGGSGSGKTTMARLILGLVRPSAGDVLFRGSSIVGRRERELGDLRSSASLVFQDPNSSLDPRMRVRDIITEPLRSPRIRGRLPARRAGDGLVASALEGVGLPAEHGARFPHQLSGGQRQRVAIARALIGDPSLLVADEPVSALDVSVRAQVLNLLTRTVAERELALVLISHDLAVVRHLCQRVVVVEAGHIVEQGEVGEVFARPRHRYTEALLEATLSL